MFWKWHYFCIRGFDSFLPIQWYWIIVNASFVWLTIANNTGILLMLTVWRCFQFLTVIQSFILGVTYNLCEPYRSSSNPKLWYRFIRIWIPDSLSSYVEDGNPSWLHIILAPWSVQMLSHTGIHDPLWKISTRPSYWWSPSTKRISFAGRKWKSYWFSYRRWKW